ncbi:hypothetical protein F5Y12DRAFT_764024 [Xylaria sp. FL1777]|nr:hypothetical protein F5Y12DRAFT_764024 [Xylaria sp. FL1777]
MSNTGPPSAGATSGASFTPQPASTTPVPTAPTNTAPTTTTTTTTVTSTTAIPPPVVPPPNNPQNLNQIVTDYLLKKGYKRTEEIFRQEVKDLDESGRPRQHTDGPVSDKFFPAGKYLSSFKYFERWVDNGLDLYKVSATTI